MRDPFVRLEHSTHVYGDQNGSRFHTAVVAARVRNVARYTSEDSQSFLDLTHVRDMKLSSPNGGLVDGTSPLEASTAAEAIESGIFSGWYEASVSSVRAKGIFEENESMTTGDEASWDIESLLTAGVLEAIHGPALEMVRMMDGVGAKVDNGQGCKFTVPTWNIGHEGAWRGMDEAEGDFW